MAHQAELRRIAKEAFDRSQKEADLAAIAIDELVLQFNAHKKMVNDKKEWLRSEGYKFGEITRYEQKKALDELEAKLADYEWELNRRRAIDKEFVEERLINTPIEEEKKNEAAKNSASYKKMIRERQSLGCCPLYRNPPLPPHTVSPAQQELLHKWFKAGG
jgi:hypothetical protein